MFRLNNRGQAFTLFKMLIMVIITTVILLIIIGSVYYFENINFSISKSRIYDALKSAVAQPNGDIIEVNYVSLEKGFSLTPASLEHQVKLDKKCITLVDVYGSEYKENSDKNILSFRNGFSGKVYARCDTNTNDTSCEIVCSVYFGKKP